MPVVDHTAPAGTYGRAGIASANLVVKASPTALTALYIRSALGFAAGLTVGGGALVAAAALTFLVAPAILLPLYLLLELTFALHLFRRLARLSAVPEDHRPPNVERDGAVAFERFLRAAEALASLGTNGSGSFVEALITRWCRAGQPTSARGAAGYGATGTHAAAMERTASALLSGVTRGNAAEMMAYGFFYADPSDVRGQAMVSRLEKAWGRSFAPGAANRDLRLMQHLNEPVRAHWRPLAFYLGTEVIALAKHWALLVSGWRCVSAASDGSTPTFYTFGAAEESSTSSNAKQTPILFCHGVGLGLAPYVPLVQQLAATGRPVIAVEFPHLAMRWTNAIPTIDEAARSIERALASVFGPAARCDAIGHSFGSMYVARLLRTRGTKLVRTVALLDPVTCAMWSGDLVSSFVYQPFAGNKALACVTGLIARDLHTAAAVCRRFYWTDCNLFAEDLAAWGRKRALLVVGGKDDLVPAAHVASTVAASEDGATMLHHSERAHADVVFDLRWQRRALDEAFAQMAAADCDEVVEAAGVTAAVIAKVSVPAATRPASVSAVCADGGDEALFLSLKRSYTIAAGVVGGGMHCRRGHARTDSGSSSASACSLGPLAEFCCLEEEERALPSPFPSPRAEMIACTA
jgi:hypothetical protein